MAVVETNVEKKSSIKWLSFGTLMLGAGTIYKLGALKDAFYVPMQEFMGLSNTQIGVAMSVAGLISTFGFFKNCSRLTPLFSSHRSSI